VGVMRKLPMPSSSALVAVAIGPRKVVTFPLFSAHGGADLALRTPPPEAVNTPLLRAKSAGFCGVICSGRSDYCWATKIGASASPAKRAGNSLALILLIESDKVQRNRITKIAAIKWLIIIIAIIAFSGTFPYDMVYQVIDGRNSTIPVMALVRCQFGDIDSDHRKHLGKASHLGGHRLPKKRTTKVTQLRDA